MSTGYSTEYDLNFGVPIFRGEGKKTLQLISIFCLKFISSIQMSLDSLQVESVTDESKNLNMVV